MARKPSTKAGQDRKFAKVMREFASGGLHSGSGQKVTNPAQAKAIAASEAGVTKKTTKTTTRRKR